MPSAEASMFGEGSLNAKPRYTNGRSTRPTKSPTFQLPRYGWGSLRWLRPSRRHHRAQQNVSSGLNRCVYQIISVHTDPNASPHKETSATQRQLNAFPGPELFLISAFTAFSTAFHFSRPAASPSLTDCSRTHCGLHCCSFVMFSDEGLGRTPNS